jgi:hypothetical protein
MPTPAEVKKALVQAGFEVYVTRGDVVHVAERVRENLLMDSGVFIRAAHPVVGFVVRAQRADFPADPDAQLTERARLLAKPALGRGYQEVKAHFRDLLDPGNTGRTLDTWCEVSFEKAVSDIDGAVDEVRFALSFEKAASPR